MTTPDEPRRTSDTAGSKAWRDSVIIVAAVLVVVSIFGWQWRTSYVLLGVLAVLYLARGIRLLLESRR